MRIKTGFRIILTVWAGMTVAAALAFAYGQHLLFEDTRQNERIERVTEEGTQLVQLTYEVLFYGEARAVEQWRLQFAEVDAAIAVLGDTHDPALRGTLDGLSYRFGQLRPVQERLIAMRADGADADAATILASQLFQDSIKLQASLRTLKTYADAALRDAYETSKQRQFTGFMLFGGLIVVYGVISLALFRAVILRPLQRLGRTIHDLRDGLAVRAKVRANDEIGTVCTAFNALLDEQETARAALHEMATRFRSVFEQAAVGMSLVSTSGALIEVNGCLCEILGRSRAELLAADYRDLAAPEDANEDIARVKAILAGEKPHDSWETRYYRGDGSLLVARVTTALARGPSGEALYLVTVTEDITERKQAEMTIRQINRQLEEQARALQRSNADLESYAWVASHDLREPLRGISNYVGLIQRKLGPDISPDMRDYTNFAIEGAKRMDALIRSLLEYARIGHGSVQTEPVALGALVGECLEALKVLTAESAAVVTVAADLPTVTAVRGELIRVFQNLIANALKYRHPERRPEVAITARPVDPGWWEVTVADNGIGIEPEYHERIFGLFQRLHPRTFHEGTGIGLTLCKKIIEQQGGTIRVDSKAGVGTAFHFTLPAAISTPQAGSPAPASIPGSYERR